MGVFSGTNALLSHSRIHGSAFSFFIFMFPLKTTYVFPISVNNLKYSQILT